MKKLHIVLALAISCFFMVGFSNASVLSMELIESWMNNSNYKDSNTTFQGKYDVSKDEYYICAGDKISCSSLNDIFHITYNSSSDTSYICAGDKISCSSLSDIFQIQGTYICPGDVITCNKSNSLKVPYFLIPIESIISILEGDDSSYSCDSRVSSCSVSEAYSQIKKSSDKYYICPGGQNTCNNQNDYLFVKKNSDKYHICGGGEISCSSVNDILQIKKSSDKYYICAGDEVSCSSINDILRIKKDSDKYYICAGDEVSCSSINDILRIKKDSDKYYSCAGNKDSCSSQSSYTKTMTKGGGTSSSMYYDANYNDYTYTKAEADKQCQAKFGQNFEALEGNLTQCWCKDGYEFNSDGSKCIKSSNNTNTVSNNTVSTNNGYSQEYQEAYEFAYANKITTMPTIEQANMNSPIIRAEIAKMLSNWVKSFGAIPDTSKSCKFNDISTVKGDLYTAIIESCQLGIMGQGISNYRPYDTITKGEVSTAVSRILRGSLYEGGDPFYSLHMNALLNAGVLDNLSNPNTNELRGNVMTILMRASKNVLNNDEEIDVDATVEEILASSSNDGVEIYNDAIVDLIVKCEDKSNALEDMYETATVKELKVANDDIINTCTSVAKSLKQLGDWENDSSFKDISIKYVAYIIAYYKQFEEKIPYLEKDLSTSEEKELEAIDKKLDEIWTKKEGARDEIDTVQQKFAKKFGYTLE